MNKTVITPYTPIKYFKVFDFGKIDYYKINKKNCKVEIVLKLDNNRLSITQRTWNNIESDYVEFGCCLESLKKHFKNNKTFNVLYRLNKLYHLNDCVAGSPQQDEYLKTLKKPDNIYFQFKYKSLYDWQCEELKKVDLLYDKSFLVDNKPYLFGSKWLKKELPNGVIEEIKELINNN